MTSLILVTTPIGNLGDITERAKLALQNTRVIASEDTRVTKDLLKHLQIDFSNKHIDSFHDHSENSKVETFLKHLENEDVVLVSDAGSPYISDPSYPLVIAAIEKGHDIQTCPGVSSVITALELSGLPATPFYFHGFLPRKEGKKSENISSFSSLKGTHIFFESVHRIKETLNTLAEVFPCNDFSIGRELTKEYETVHRGNTSKIKETIADLIEKGEFVICIYNELEGKNNSKVTKLAQDVLDAKGKPKAVAKLLAEILGEDTKSIYGRLANS